ncbi:hypothetical protein BB560_004097 [Smittium megazygosporum]|uniref:Uncharacterized protein n=1 Tax=Smittium megazygosporum TaxID=133381 RepID=A0A2T9ZA85_9FUNG|nr:hypothetical protein BB560_004097 [Smittium megazygosporum]
MKSHPPHKIAICEIPNGRETPVACIVFESSSSDEFQKKIYILSQYSQSSNRNQVASMVSIDSSYVQKLIIDGLSKRTLYSRSKDIAAQGWASGVISALASNRPTSNIRCTNCKLNTKTFPSITIKGLGTCYYGWCRSNDQSSCYYNILGGYWYSCIPSKYKNFGSGKPRPTEQPTTTTVTVTTTTRC